MVKFFEANPDDGNIRNENERPSRLPTNDHADDMPIQELIDDEAEERPRDTGRKNSRAVSDSEEDDAKPDWADKLCGRTSSRR